MCIKCKCNSQIYVKDIRTPVLFQNKRLKYPKNYDKIVKNGVIIQREEGGETVLRLLYGKKDKDGLQPSFTLVPVTEDVCHSKSYYTLYSLCFGDISTLGSSFYEPFGFTKIKLEKYLPIIDIKKTDDPNNPYQIANTLYIADKGCAISEETGEVDANTRKEKGLNGKQLYYASYKKTDPRFWVIRDELKKIVLDASIICFLVCLLVYTVIFMRKIITCLPMKLGECLLGLKNPLKYFGHIFFTPFVPLKFIVDLSAVFVKFPVLLFAGNEKKHGNKYWALWKHEFIECFKELISDCSVIKNGCRPVLPDCEEYTLIGTWKELDIRNDYHTSNHPCV